MEDYKVKYIALRKAITNLKRNQLDRDTLKLLGFEYQEFTKSSEALAAAIFERKDRENFIKRLNKEKVDLSDLTWWKKDLDVCRKRLQKINENDPDYKWLFVLEGLLSNYVFGSFGGAFCAEFWHFPAITSE